MGIKQIVAAGNIVIALSEGGQAFQLKGLANGENEWLPLPELPVAVN